MGQGYLLDSNVIIDLIGKKLPIQTINVIGENFMLSSDVSRIEVLGFSNSIEEEESFISFFSDLKILSLDEAVIQKSIQIRKQKRIKLGDAIIAATALVHNLKLITRNVVDFNGIDDLELINSFPQ
jgi:predicted nucleic acid-binding protein